MNEEVVKYCEKCKERIESSMYNGSKCLCLKCKSAVTYIKKTTIIDDTLIVIGNIYGHYVIPDGVKFISGHSFSDTSISEITIPHSVKEIESGTFYGCKNLKKITVKGDTKINSSAFLGCSEVTEVVMNGVCSNENGFSCFWKRLEKLKRIVLPEGITEIGERAFGFLKDLEEVILPSTIKKIGEEAFNYCESLKRIVIPEGVTEIGKKAFYGCKKLSVVRLPDSLNKIGDYVFQDVPISMAILPSQMTDFEISTFEGIGYSYSYSKYRYFAPENADVKRTLNRYNRRFKLHSMPGGLLLESPVVDGVLYYAEPENKKITIPPGIKVIDKCVVPQKCNVDEIVIPDSVTEIKENAFENCININSVKFGNQIKSIGSKAFSGVKEQYINLPESVVEFAPDAFDSSCVVALNGEMPLYNEKVKKLDSTRIVINDKVKSIADIAVKVSDTKEALKLHQSSRPSQFDTIPEYHKKIDDIDKRKAEALSVIEQKADELTKRINQIDDDIRNITEERRNCFFLAISKKRNLDESLADKQNEKKELVEQKRQVNIDERDSINKKFSDELKTVRLELQRIQASKNKWDGEEDALKSEISNSETQQKRITSELDVMKKEFEISEKNLAIEHTKWKKLRERVINRQRINALQYEKNQIISKLKFPEYTVIPSYEYKPCDAILEEQLLNQLYAEAIVIWNNEAKTTAYNQFVEKCQEQLERVKEINTALNLDEMEGISEYIIKNDMSKNNLTLPERFVKLNNYFSKNDVWKQLIRELKAAVNNSKMVNPLKKLFAETPYFYVANDKQVIYIFPYVIVVWQFHKPLKVLTYNKTKIVVKYIDKEFEGNKIPKNGELINEHYKYLKVDGTPNRRYKNNPLVKTIRFSTIEIVVEKRSLSFPLKNYQNALKVERCFNEFFGLFKSKTIKGVYSEILKSEKLDTIEATISAISEKEKTRKIFEKQKESEEKQRLEQERLAEQLASQEKKRSIIERQRQINAERKQQKEKDEAEKRKIEALFADDFQNNAKSEDDIEKNRSTDTGIRICSNQLISNTVFKVQLEVDYNVINRDMVAFFVSDTGQIISNKKILAKNNSGGNNLTVGFVLNSGIDYSNMKKCAMCFESDGERIFSVDFKMSISFFSDF